MSLIHCSTAALQTGAGAVVCGNVTADRVAGAGDCSIWAKHRGSKTVRIQAGNRHRLQVLEVGSCIECAVCDVELSYAGL